MYIIYGQGVTESICTYMHEQSTGSSLLAQFINEWKLFPLRLQQILLQCVGSASMASDHRIFFQKKRVIFQKKYCFICEFTWTLKILNDINVEHKLYVRYRRYLLGFGCQNMFHSWLYHRPAYILLESLPFHSTICWYLLLVSFW